MHHSHIPNQQVQLSRVLSFAPLQHQGDEHGVTYASADINAPEPNSTSCCPHERIKRVVIENSIEFCIHGTQDRWQVRVDELAQGAAYGSQGGVQAPCGIDAKQVAVCVFCIVANRRCTAEKVQDVDLQVLWQAA